MTMHQMVTDTKVEIMISAVFSIEIQGRFFKITINKIEGSRKSTRLFRDWIYVTGNDVVYSDWSSNVNSIH